VRSGQARSVGLPQPGARALEKLIERKTPVIGISFGNPYVLLSFPKLQTYVVAYGDMPSLQEATERALLGQIDIGGRLPISLPGLYPRGTGIRLVSDRSERDYRIRPNDMLDVRLIGQPDGNNVCQVDKAGMIRMSACLPFANDDMRAAGKTTDELAAEMTIEMKKYLKKPEIRLSVSRRR